MTLFWLAVAGLLLGVAGFLFWPLVVAQEQYAKFALEKAPTLAKKDKKARIDNSTLTTELNSHKQRNIEIFKERLSELEAEKAQGTLDANTFAQLKIELEKSLLNDVATDTRPTDATPLIITAKHWFIGALMTLAVAVWSIGLYVALGRGDDLATRLAMQAQGTLQPLDAGETAQAMSPAANQKAPDLMKALEMLQAKVKEDPKNVNKWFLLANTYAATGQYAKAAETFLAIEKIVPKDSPDYAAIKGSYAQALYLANDEKVTEPVKAAIAAALAIDPKEPNALVLKGVEAYEQAAYKPAIGFWEQAKINANPQLIAQFINPSIAAAQEKLGIAPAPISKKPTAVATASPALHLVVDIAPALKAKTASEQTVFIFAKPQGGKMPLAVERLTVKDLPANVVLDDSKAAMPTATLSSVEIVDITARISSSGSAIAQSGDLFAAQEKVVIKQADNPIKLMINQVMP